MPCSVEHPSPQLPSLLLLIGLYAFLQLGQHLLSSSGQRRVELDSPLKVTLGLGQVPQASMGFGPSEQGLDIVPVKLKDGGGVFHDLSVLAKEKFALRVVEQQGNFHLFKSPPLLGLRLLMEAQLLETVESFVVRIRSPVMISGTVECVPLLLQLGDLLKHLWPGEGPGALLVFTRLLNREQLKLKGKRRLLAGQLVQVRISSALHHGIVATGMLVMGRGTTVFLGLGHVTQSLGHFWVVSCDLEGGKSQKVCMVSLLNLHIRSQKIIPQQWYCADSQPNYRN